MGGEREGEESNKGERRMGDKMGRVEVEGGQRQGGAKKGGESDKGREERKGGTKGRKDGQRGGGWTDAERERDREGSSGDKCGTGDNAYMAGIVLEEFKVLCTSLAVVNDIFLQHSKKGVHYHSNWAVSLVGEEGGGEEGGEGEREEEGRGREEGGEGGEDNISLCQEESRISLVVLQN